MRNARVLLTWISTGWLSAVPRKFTPGVVPALPPVFQKFDADKPPSVTALTLVSPPPLPLKSPPLTRLPAVMAYGVGVTFCRGLNFAYPPVPLVDRRSV